MKSWHWRECKLNFQETVGVGRGGEGCGGPDAAFGDLRLVQRRAMEIVEEAEFIGVFRAAGRLDILEAGTGCPQTEVPHGGADAPRTTKKMAKKAQSLNK